MIWMYSVSVVTSVSNVKSDVYTLEAEGQWSLQSQRRFADDKPLEGNTH